jgi:hypothetical protein
MLCGVEHEIGDVIGVTFFPQGPEGPVYPAQVRIVAWDESTKTMRFEKPDGTMPFSLTVNE